VAVEKLAHPEFAEIGSHPPHFSSFPWLKTAVIPTCEWSSGRIAIEGCVHQVFASPI
jgi:hypothetical protein